MTKELTDFLGFKHKHTAFMIGVGSLGGALIQDTGLAHYGLNVVAGFDVNPKLVGTTIKGIPIYDINDLAQQQKKYDVSIAVLTVPVNNAQNAADHAIACGIKALWNFTPYRIKAPADVVIQNTSIYAHLALMYNRLETNKHK